MAAYASELESTRWQNDFKEYWSLQWFVRKKSVSAICWFSGGC